MNSFELNKIMGAVFGALLFVVGISVVAGMLFQPRPSQLGELILPEPVEDADAVADVVQVDPLPVRLANASVDRGEAAFRACASCHTVNPGGENRVGPNLWNIVMAPMADRDFNYSSALAARGAEGGVWSFESLDAFIENPRAYVSGTSMAYAGLSNIDTRANLLAYLRSLSDDPAPLPEASEDEAALDGEEETVAQ
ncbi:MAG: c-type cytochrome [Salinarimonas sp.]